MVKINSMEHCDKFCDNEYVCYVAVGNVPNKFIEQAKEIDKENYTPDCFGLWVGNDEEGWFVGQDSPGCELYYIDNDGEKYWMEYVLSDDEKETAIKYCKEYIGIE